MCTILKGSFRLQSPMTVFKVVNRYIRCSVVTPTSRDRLIEFYESDQTGTMLEYPFGATVTSPSGPGIMVFADQAHARNYAAEEAAKVIKLEIPSGAVVRMGYQRGVPILAVSKVKVVS